MANKFNELYNVNDLQESLKKAQENTTEFPEIPVGKYEVKIEKIELRSTKEGNKPMGTIQFVITDGEYKKFKLFYNQVLVGTDKTTGQLTTYGLHHFNEFLKSLDSGLEIKFVDFNQYENLLLDVAEKVEHLIYEIQYGKNNDFPTYKILDIFEEDLDPTPDMPF